MIIVNGYKPLTIITKSSMLDVAAVINPPLHFNRLMLFVFNFKTDALILPCNFILFYIYIFSVEDCLMRFLRCCKVTRIKVGTSFLLL